MRVDSVLWKLFRGCGHSFHVACLLPDISICKICQAQLLEQIKTLGKTANKAVFSSVDDQSTDEEIADTEDDDDDTDDDDDLLYDDYAARTKARQTLCFRPFATGEDMITPSKNKHDCS